MPYILSSPKSDNNLKLKWNLVSFNNKNDEKELTIFAYYFSCKFFIWSSKCFTNTSLIFFINTSDASIKNLKFRPRFFSIKISFTVFSGSAINYLKSKVVATSKFILEKIAEFCYPNTKLAISIYCFNFFLKKFLLINLLIQQKIFSLFFFD